MSLSQKILGVEIGEISLKILQSFFQEEKEESDVLEFKSFHTEKNNQNDYKHKEDGVLRTICAFLNSNGGLLIWGAPGGEKRSSVDSKKVFTGKLSPVDRDIEKDAFISKLANRIIPSPSGIRFGKIKVEENEFVYVIEVEQSLTKPHQVNNTYFMRLDGQTVTAPHHYIEALFKQIKYPHLEGYISFGKISTYNTSIFYMEISVVIFNFSPFQNEENVSFQLTASVGVFNQTNDKNVSITRTKEKGGKMVFKNFADVLHYGVPHRHATTLAINSIALISKDYEIMFSVNFGGRLSPRKISGYKIRFDASLNEYLILNSEENALMYEVNKDKENKEEMIKKLLGR